MVCLCVATWGFLDSLPSRYEPGLTLLSFQQGQGTLDLPQQKKIHRLVFIWLLPLKIVLISSKSQATYSSPILGALLCFQGLLVSSVLHLHPSWAQTKAFALKARHRGVYLLSLLVLRPGVMPCAKLSCPVSLQSPWSAGFPARHRRLTSENIWSCPGGSQ